MTNDDRAEAVDAIFETWNRTDSPGMAVGVWQDGDVVFAKGYGMASLELGVPISPASVFHVASVSKQFCAISAALLAEEGKLDLDEDIRTYVPEMPDLGHTITVRQLIHHTNGLRDQYGLFRLAGWRDGDAQEFDDVLDFAYRHRRLNFPPGSQYAYCNTSYTLVALAIARQTGTGLRAYANEKIFQPLGMTSTMFLDKRNEVVKSRANAYAPGDGDGFKTLNSNVDALGAICLYTSVEDQLKWLANLSQRTVASGVLDEAMTSARLTTGEETGYGFGLGLKSYRGLQTVGHGGVDAGYRAQITFIPEANFGIVILSNLSSVKPAALAHKMADLFLADRLGPVGLASEPEVELSEDELERVAGIYIHPDRGITRILERREEGLHLVTGFGPDLRLSPLGNGRFRLDEPAFEMDIIDEDGMLRLKEIGSEGVGTTYDKVEEVSPTIEELAGCVGSYYCPEIGATQHLAIVDGALRVKQRKTEAQSLRPASADVFVNGMNSFRFQRDSRGNVASFQLFNDRIRYLQFDRV